MDIREVRLDVFLKFLEQERGYSVLSSLGSGSFGDVYKMKEPRKIKEVAVKLVVYSYEDSLEGTLWPKLDHKHLLPLSDVIHMDEFGGMTAFVMPLMERSLREVLKDPAFGKEQGSFGCTKRWLYQVLKAMEYLASKRLCHLDIKGDNVLVSREMKAVLCDFSFINSTKEPVDRDRVGLPCKYRPPELCYTRYPGDEVTANGQLVDLWSFGAMSLQLLTGFPIRMKGRGVETWATDVYPLFWKALQEETFFRNLSRTFPSDPLDATEKKHALDFVHGFLITYDKLRVGADFAKSHCFLDKGRKLFHQRDDIWRENTMSPTPDETPSNEPDPVDLQNAPSKEKDTEKPNKKGIGQRLRGAWKRIRSFFNRKEEMLKVPDDNLPQNPEKDPQLQGSLEAPINEHHSNPHGENNLQTSLVYSLTLEESKPESSSHHVNSSLGFEEQVSRLLDHHTCNVGKSARYVAPCVSRVAPLLENNSTTNESEKTTIESYSSSPVEPSEDNIENVVRDILVSIVSVIAIEPDSRQHDDRVEELLHNTSSLPHSDVGEKYLENTMESNTNTPSESPTLLEKYSQRKDDRFGEVEKLTSEMPEPLIEKSCSSVHHEVSKGAGPSVMTLKDEVSFKNIEPDSQIIQVLSPDEKEDDNGVSYKRPAKKSFFKKFGLMFIKGREKD